MSSIQQNSPFYIPTSFELKENVTPWYLGWQFLRNAQETRASSSTKISLDQVQQNELDKKIYDYAKEEWKIGSEQQEIEEKSTGLNAIKKLMLTDKSNELAKKFFKEFSINEDMAKGKALELMGLELEYIGICRESIVRRLVVINQIFLKSGMKKSSWNPNQPIIELTRQLHLHGPHLFKGRLGKAHYKAEPFELKGKKEGRSVYGWMPGSAQIERPPYTVGLVVLADEKHVYYLDPKDRSTDISTQKLYIMSYDKFKTSVFDLEDPIKRKKDYAFHA